MTMRGVKANFKMHFKQRESRTLLLCGYDCFLAQLPVGKKRGVAGWQEDRLHKIYSGQLKQLLFYNINKETFN